MRYPWFFSRTGQLWRDGWSYGDWNQYICNRPGGRTQCARFSQIPVFAGLIGMALVSMALFGILLSTQLEGLNWPVVIACLVIGSVLMAPGILGYFFGVYLMKAVGPYNDGARRVCPWDEDVRS